MLPRDLTPTHPPTPISLVISLHLILGLARISHPGCLMTQTSAVSPPSPSPPCLSSSEIPARCVNCSPAGMNGQDPGQGHPAERSIRGTRPAGPAPSPSWTCAENRRPVPGSVTRPTYVFASEFSPWKAFPVAGSAAASPGRGFVVLEREGSSPDPCLRPPNHDPEQGRRPAANGSPSSEADLQRFIFRGRPPGRWGLGSQRPSPGRTGGWHLEACPHLSVQAEVPRGGGGQSQGIQGGGCKALYTQTGAVRSDKSRDGPVLVSLAWPPRLHGQRSASLLQPRRSGSVPSEGSS